MWLDRFSGHATPTQAPSQNHSRPYSPNSVRKQSHLASNAGAQRPGGFSPRTSSLNLVHNDSTTSLLSNSRKTNGSNLRQSSSVLDDSQPIEVLEKLLGAEGLVAGKTTGDKGHTNEEEDEIDFNGFTLQDLAKVALHDCTTTYKPQSVEECM